MTIGSESGFRRNSSREPDVAFLIDQIKSTSERLDQVRVGDPALDATRKRLAKLTREYSELWETRSEELRRRLLDEQNLSGGKTP